MLHIGSELRLGSAESESLRRCETDREGLSNTVAPIFQLTAQVNVDRGVDVVDGRGAAETKVGVAYGPLRAPSKTAGKWRSGASYKAAVHWHDLFAEVLDIT